MSDGNFDLMTAYYDLLAWLETIPLSRPVQALESDFSDGILIAEIVAYFFPEYVDLEIFQPARNMSQRTKNWRLLNAEVLPKISLHAPGTVVHDMTNGDHRAVELFLLHLREKLEEHLIRTGRKSRLQWETWRSYNNERHRLPPLLMTPRAQHPPTASYLSRYPSIHRPGRYPPVDPYAASWIYDESARFKDEQMEILHGKLKRCEKMLTSKERKIQQLEEQIEKLKHKRSAP